jgi:hypothetical protein
MELSMPKKKTKYPAKFRATLEKVAAGREGRETAPEADHNPVFDTLYRSVFLPNNSVNTMYARFDETPFGPRLITRHVLLAETGVHDVIRAAPPWDEEEEPE